MHNDKKINVVKQIDLGNKKVRKTSWIVLKYFRYVNTLK